MRSSPARSSYRYKSHFRHATDYKLSRLEEGNFLARPREDNLTMKDTAFRIARLSRAFLLLTAAIALSGLQVHAASTRPSSMKDVRSAEDAVGKWVFEGEDSGFSGSVILVLRKNQTFTLTIDGRQNGVALQHIGEGGWAWIGTAHTVILPDPPPVELGSLERAVGFFSAGPVE